jgi:hypothetical protein
MSRTRYTQPVSTTADSTTEIIAAAPEGFGIRVDVDRSDVMAVLINKTEIRFQDQLDAAMTEISRLNEKIATDGHALNLSITASGCASLKAEADTFLKAAKAFGFTAQAQYSYRHGDDVRKPNTYTATVTVSLADPAKSGTYGNPGLTLNTTRTFPMNAAQTKLNVAIQAQLNERELAQKQAGIARKNLQDMPKLERKAKAALAEQMIRATPEGARMLNTMISGLERGADLTQFGLPAPR